MARNASERYRESRRLARRRVHVRRIVALVVVLALAAAVVGVVRVLAGGGSGAATASAPTTAARARPVEPKPRPVPAEIRGVHVTMPLASLPGKIDQYLAMPGLNTLELDVKDENGMIAFRTPPVALARRIGAAQPYYQPRAVARNAHRHGVYLIGRVVVFEDPVLSERRPDLALLNGDGSVWHNNAGLGWTNPYDRRVWHYNVDVAVAAVRAGFDEIQFDYVRFPSDGDVTKIVYPHRLPEKKGWTIARFLHFAAKRVHPLGGRVSADVFGLSATRDLGIGQVPRRISRYVDAIYPMVYPSHYNPGEFSLTDPNAAPGTTVSRSLRDFRRQLRGRKARIVPWLQDFSLGRTYTLADVQLQVAAARRWKAGGFLLWNPLGLYTPGVLTSRSPEAATAGP